MSHTKIALEEQHILAVDDNKQNLLLITLLLNEYGVHHIYEAHSAKEAYTILESHPIDAILMDVMMPEIDGIEATRAIRAVPHYDQIPIIMVTANNDNDTFKKSFEAGADDFLSKPINDVKLIARLTSQLQRRQLQQTLVQQSRYSAMDEMVSMLAHQWRQPLSLINTLSNTIRTRIQLESITQDEIDKSLENIEDHIGSLSTMIDNFKDHFTATESSECTDIQELIQQVLSLRKEVITKLHIKVIVDIPQIAYVVLKRQALIQVLVNLLNNAIESLMQNPVNEPSITIKVEQNPSVTTLILTDNGQGISEADMPHIYEPYFSTKREKNGKGLGLYFSKQLANEQLQGNLEIFSSQGKTSCYVTIKNEKLC